MTQDRKNGLIQPEINCVQEEVRPTFISSELTKMPKVES